MTAHAFHKKRLPVSPEKLLLMEVMHAAGHPPRAIARVTGFTLRCVRDRVVYDQPRRRRFLARGDARGRPKVRLFQREQKRFVPEAVVLDCQRRARLSPRDLTAAYFGDPLPGYSALDRREQ